MSGKLNSHTVNAILIVRPDAIGDVILTLPLINSLKTQFPDATLTLYTKKNYTDLLLPHPSIDALVYSLEDLKIGVFDMAVCPFLNNKIAKTLKRAKIPIRIGDTNQVIPGLAMNYGVRLNYQDIRMHVVEQNLALIEPIIDEKSRTEKMDLYVTQYDEDRLDKHLAAQGDAGQSLIAIQPCTGGSDKHWPTLHYVELINLIQEHTPYKIIITGAGEKEEQVIQEIMSFCTSKPLTLIGFDTFPELKALLKRAHMVIGTNTGPLHVAAALGCPVLSLFPSKFIKPSVWAPWGVLHRVVVSKKGCPFVCKPLTCKPVCQGKIIVAQVWKAFNHLLHDIATGKPYSKIASKTQWLNMSGSLAYFVEEKADLSHALDVLRDSHAMHRILILKKKNDTEFLPKNSKIKVLVLPKWQIRKWQKAIVENDIVLLKGIKKSSRWYTLLSKKVALKVYAPPLIET